MNSGFFSYCHRSASNGVINGNIRYSNSFCKMNPSILRVFAEEMMEDVDSIEPDVIVEAQTLVALSSSFAIGFAKEFKTKQPVKIQNYVEAIVPMYSDLEFKAHFRMQRSTADVLIQFLTPFINERTVCTEKKFLATLWLLGNQESFRGVADRFGFSKGFLHSCFLQVVEVLAQYTGDFIKWPEARDFTKIAHAFFTLKGFPGAIGAIDGKHVAIPGPSTYRESYINRKGYPSIQLQAVCDNTLKFTDVYVGCPGCVHDARVYKNSPLYQHLQRHPLPSNFHLIGDSAYALSANLMVPFRDNGHLSPIQKKYNKTHSSTRVQIERAFGLLTSKFTRLNYLHMINLYNIPKVITVCTILHNIIISHEGINEDIQELNVEIDHYEAEAQEANNNNFALEKRQDIANMLGLS